MLAFYCFAAVWKLLADYSGVIAVVSVFFQFKENNWHWYQSSLLSDSS